MRANKSTFLIIFLIVVTIVQGFFASRLVFNYDFESFFPKNDPELEFFQKHREKFGNDNDFLLVAVSNKKSVFDTLFLQRVSKLTNDIKQAPNVADAYSLVTAKNQLITFSGPIEVPYLHLHDPTKLANDSSLIFTYPDLVGTLISKDAKHLCVFIETKTIKTKPAGDSLVFGIEAALSKNNFDDYHFSGRYKAEQVYVDRMQVELGLFVGSSAVLIVLFLFFTYRSFLGVIIPLTVVLLSVIWSLGTMGMFNKPIDLMTVLLPTIMFIVGISDVIHIISKYIEEARIRPKKEAIKITIKEVGLATFFTSLTTAIGFFTLYSTEIVPVQEFGIFTGVGVFLAFGIAFTLLPAILHKFPIEHLKERKHSWEPFLTRLLGWIFRSKKSILIGAIAISIGAIITLPTIAIDVKLIDELNEGDPLKDDFVFFENSFSGVRPFELSLATIDSSKTLFDEDCLAEIEALQQFLEDSIHVNSITSPISVIYSINRALNGGIPEAYTFPNNSRDFKKVMRYLKKGSKSKKMDRFVNDEWNNGRLFGRMGDIGSAAMKVKLQQINTYSAQFKHVKFKPTGSVLLIDKSNYSLSTNMLEGLAIAFVIVAIIMGFLFKSTRIIVLSLIPNVVPLLLIASILGVSGIGLKISTAIIFTIAFGIAVDDTIHFMSKLKIELDKGKPLLYAIKRTFISTGKAIIVTSFVLSAGFMTLILSNFNGTFYTGLLVSLTLVFAVFADLLLIPVLLIYFFPKKK